MKILVTEAGRLPAAPATPQSPIRLLVWRMRALWRTLLRPVRRSSKSRHDEYALRALTDRELRDIGLDRSEIGSIVRMSANDSGRVRRRSA